MGTLGWIGIVGVVMGVVVLLLWLNNRKDKSSRTAVSKPGLFQFPYPGPAVPAPPNPAPVPAPPNPAPVPAPSAAGTYDPLESIPVVTPQDAPRSHPRPEIRDGFPWMPVDDAMVVDPKRGELYTAPTYVPLDGRVFVYVYAVLATGKPARGAAFQLCDGNHLPIVPGHHGVPGLLQPGTIDRVDSYPWNQRVAVGGERPAGWHRDAFPDEAYAVPVAERVALSITPRRDYAPYGQYGRLDDDGEWFGEIRLDRPIRQLNIGLFLKVNGSDLFGPGEKDGDVAQFVTKVPVEFKKYLKITEDVFAELARASADRT